MVCIIGAFCMLFATTYIAHGFSRKTTAALMGTAFSLIFASVLSYLCALVTGVIGLGDQSPYIFQFAAGHPINPQGLFLGGVLIGSAGALNDITTSQSSTVFALVKEMPQARLFEVFWKAMRIGQEHIASMINTLVLAYAGSSFAIFLFFVYNPNHLQWWLILNDEATLEEILRTVAGSAAIILAIPITTFLACWICRSRWIVNKEPAITHSQIKSEK
jgi:uncharacterized membrane protein